MKATDDDNRGGEGSDRGAGAAGSANDGPAFFCDAMLGGLARWLRAAGYDAAYEYGIDDAELLRRAKAEGRIVLSSDGGIFLRNVVKNGHIKSLFVPQQMGKFDALRFVMRELKLPLRESRCMACGGKLREAPRHEAATEAPPLAFRYSEKFWRCGRCGKLLWRGTHWERITKRLSGMF